MSESGDLTHGAPRGPGAKGGTALARTAQGHAWTDLMGSLIWPSLLRAAPLALRPARLGMAFMLVMTLAILVVAADAWVLRGNREGVRGLGEITKDHLAVVAGRLEARQIGPGLLALLLLPARLFREHPGVAMLLTVPVAAASAVFGGAIGRTAATEFGRRERSAWLPTLTLSLSRWWTQALAVLVPLALVGVTAALLAVAGKVLLGFGSVAWLGGLLFGGGVLLGAVVVVCIVVLVLALPMLGPAVLVEGTDSIDSIQRCCAYVVAQPLRFVLYAALLLAQALIMTALLGALVNAACALTGALSAMFLPGPYGALVRQAAAFGTLPAVELDAAEYPAWQVRTGEMIVLWRGVLMLAPAVYAVSFFYTAGSVLYLSMRRLCDGQDPGELWGPQQDDDAGPRSVGGDEGEEL